MILGVAAVFVAVAVSSLSGLESQAKPTCLVSLMHASLHLIQNSGVLGGKRLFSFSCFPLEKKYIW